MAWYHKLENPKAYILGFIKWLALGLLLGIIGGLLGTFFHEVLELAGAYRTAHPVLIFFLPFAGLSIAGIYKLTKLDKTRGTNEMIDAVNEKRDVHPLLAPVIFAATALTHLFGGSAGREGAALQLGGTLGSIAGRLLRLSREDRQVMILSGMSAVFAALFGTPLTAALFSVEFIAVGNFFGPGFLPSLVAAFTASRIALAFGAAPTAFTLEKTQPLDFPGVAQTAVLAVLVALVSMAFCFIMHKTEHGMAKMLPNPFVRIFAGGCAVVLLTLLVQTHDYNGAGMDVVARAIQGQALPWAFALKIIFTALTLGSGFKGGEIVPTFFVGATFGCAVAPLLGMDPGVAAALGMIGMFCCVTNSPFTSMILGIEIFGGAHLLPFAIVCAIGFVLSGNSGLYVSQRIVYSKIAPKVVNRYAG